MNLVYLFMTSAAFGIMVAAPVGPMALLCMRRTLALGWRQGMATGSGIAVADAIYAAVAAFGLTGLARAAAGHDRLLQGAAGIVLILLGVKSLFQRARPTGSGAEPAAVQPPWPAAFAGAVLLTLANPPTKASTSGSPARRSPECSSARLCGGWR
jgi:threonine/homoserine/homoserine lactone efflux protein